MIPLQIPRRINRLEELANNLWWSWHEEARRLFRALDYQLWRTSGHNPVQQLRLIRVDALKAAANDPGFLELYDSVMSSFDADMSASNHTWFATNYSNLLSGPIAYFSMEYAIHNSLPIYAGGLGVLAGDICKEASDLGLPMVAIGFMYPQGYFHQHMSENGWQEEIYQQLKFEETPIKRVTSAGGGNTVAQVQLGDVTIAIGVWHVCAGRTDIYLLDTNLEENPSQYRELSARLYIADRELRIQQEIVLGIGGVRVLRALNINPSIWHGNEGHTAFMMLERAREGVAKGMSFAEAVKQVQATTVLTSHTPVMAGHDIFPVELLEGNLNCYWESLGIDRETFFRLGQQDSECQTFNMTALALRMSNQRCAVSQLHGKVARKMWHGLWPDIPEDQVPISHVTNGIHAPSWIARELFYLFERYLGNNWIEEHDDSRLWERLLDIPDGEFWEIHQLLKRKLVGAIRERMRSRWLEGEVPCRQMVAMGSLLDPEVLTIAFARRFTEYKRPTLLFHDVERLRRIVNNWRRPVQIIFAGKSHPDDLPSKHILQQVYSLATDREYQGRIAFVEDYDMHISRYLVHGVDVWLNNPRRLQEASGTSGMKASLNGVLHLSIRDGWWHEGYNDSNGWAIGSDLVAPTPEEEDYSDAESLYRLLEDDIVPLYYTRDRNGVPGGWVSLMKESIRSIVPVFSARRMLKEYTERMYRVAAQQMGSNH